MTPEFLTKIQNAKPFWHKQGHTFKARESLNQVYFLQLKVNHTLLQKRRPHLRSVENNITMKPMHPKVIKALKSYVPDDGQNSSETITTLSQNKLIFETRTITHDESIFWLLAEFKKAQKNTIVNDFIYGIQESVSNYRAAFSAFAVAQNFPPHDFTGSDVCCTICGGFLEQTIDLTFVNSIRYTYDSIQILTPAHLAFYLEQHNHQHHAKQSSYEKFASIMTEIFKSPPQETPTSLADRLSSLKKINIKKMKLEVYLKHLDMREF